MVLNECGHSYCLQCIQDNSTEVGFVGRSRFTVTPDQNDDGKDSEENLADDDDLLNDDAPELPEDNNPIDSKSPSRTSSFPNSPNSWR